MRLSPHVAVVCVLAACSGGGRTPRDAGPIGDAEAPEDASERAVLEPVTEHDVVQRDCRSTRLAPTWWLQPTPLDQCPFGASSNCGTACVTAADCVAEPFGRCVAAPRGRCEYVAGQSTRRPCMEDHECTLASGGRCVRAYRSERSYCQYDEARFNQDDSCALSSDCKLADQGVCVHELTRTFCDYQGCLSDDDCGPGAACLCDQARHHCVPANCREDADCQPGHRCRPSQQVLGSTDGLYCTTDDDPCERDADCARQGEGRVCAYDSRAGRWDCLEQQVVGP